MEPRVLQEAHATPDKIKGALVYNDEDALDTGMQKVQPLPFLDEEIHKYVQVIEASIPDAKKVNDVVPEKVLETVETVIRVAKEGKTTLFKASDVLELTTDAYQYARRACIDDFELERESGAVLRNYDDVFKRMIQNRIETKVDDAEEDLRDCRDLLNEAAKKAEKDRRRLAERAEKEESYVSEDVLNDICTGTQDNIKDEKAELEHIIDQCDKDITKIDNSLGEFHNSMDQAASERNQKKISEEKQLRQNRERQRQLEEELARLKTQEMHLMDNLETGEQLREQLDSARERANEEVEEWKTNIVELKQRTHTSLNIVHRMEECTDLILSDAKEKKKEWKKRLATMDMDSLLDYRDALMAQGVLFTVIARESNSNSKYASVQLKKLEDEKREASRTGFMFLVKELGEKVQKYTVQKEKLQAEMGRMTDLLTEVRDKLKDADAKIRQLRPSFRLDALDDRFKHWKRMMDQAFEKNAAATVNFNSIGNYN